VEDRRRPAPTTRAKAWCGGGGLVGGCPSPAEGMREGQGSAAAAEQGNPELPQLLNFQFCPLARSAE